MTGSLFDSTLEGFRQAAASAEPMPAGVAVAAVSASFAFGVLAKALLVSRRRRTAPADAERLEALAHTARSESSRMLQLAGADAAAFEAYLAAARMPGTSGPERLERERAIDSAVHRAIELPLAAARSAAAGLQLCGEAVSLTHPVVLADLASALTLLQGAVRAFLVCAQSNVTQLASQAGAGHERLAAEAQHCSQVLRQAEEALERLAAALAAAPAGPPKSLPGLRN